MSPSTPTERVAFGRLLWAGPLDVIASVAANALVRAIAQAVFEVPPEFRPFAAGQFIFLTVAGTVGATIVFAVVGWLAKRPIRAFTWIAAVALVLSWLPDFGLLAAKRLPGVSVQSVGALMFMHVVAAAISFGLLTRLGRKS